MDANFWRGVIFTQAALVFLMTLVIVIRYGMAFALASRKDRALPLHVLSIAISYLLATIYIVMEIRTRWDMPTTYRTPMAAVIFILGDAALVFMLMHITVQRKFLGQVREHVANEVVIEKAELAAELKHQTNGLAQMIKAVGERAESAYHEANDVNNKIVGFNEKVSGQLSDIKDNAETARKKAVEAVLRAEDIGNTGKDTNVRVRDIQGLKKEKTK